MKLRRNYGYSLLWQQFRALMTKRLIFSLRNKKVTIAQFLVPIIWSTIPGFVINSLPTAGPPPALTMDLAKWTNTRTPYETNGTGIHLQSSYVTLLFLFYIYLVVTVAVLYLVPTCNQYMRESLVICFKTKQRENLLYLHTLHTYFIHVIVHIVR